MNHFVYFLSGRIPLISSSSYDQKDICLFAFPLPPTILSTRVRMLVSESTSDFHGTKSPRHFSVLTYRTCQQLWTQSDVPPASWFLGLYPLWITFQYLSLAFCLFLADSSSLTYAQCDSALGLGLRVSFHFFFKFF